jgi:hypothetical protein
MTFEEAEVTLVCRKLFCQRLDFENMNLDRDQQAGERNKKFFH